jgi:GNAT superfamily N-acetyltransferase
MDGITIEFMTGDDLPVVGEMFGEIFDNIYKGEVRDIRKAFLWNLSNLITPSISLVARHEDRIVAAYGLREECLAFDMADPDPIYDEHGLKGVVLAIEPEYQRAGLGSRLVMESKKLAGDLGKHYVFGSHDKRLNNIGFWKKHRDVVADAGSHYVTAKVLYNEDV